MFSLWLSPFRALKKPPVRVAENLLDWNCLGFSTSNPLLALGVRSRFRIAFDPDDVPVVVDKQNVVETSASKR